MSDNKNFVVVAGNIGTGKTSLTALLADRLGWESHFEAVAHNPYLADFYKDMTRWSLPLQIYFLNARARTHSHILSGSASAIQDRSIYEGAHIFARSLYESGDMEPRDYRSFMELYETIAERLTPPDLVVYLRKSVPNLRAQIAKRGRDYEQDIPVSYITSLNQYYDEWIQSYDKGPKLIIESDSLDFVGCLDDFEHAFRLIKHSLPQPAQLNLSLHNH